MRRIINSTLRVAIIALLISLHSCQSEKSDTTLDSQLEQSLVAASKDGVGKSFFRLPESHEFGLIPQDPRNPISTFKVALGKLLFHETAIGVTPKVSIGAQTYSCASCHHAAGGFWHKASAKAEWVSV